MKRHLLIWVAFLMVACSPVGEDTKTSRNANRKEVRFISLPDSASEIRFWDDGNNRMATFKVLELEFTRMFPDTKFIEITEADNLFYCSESYGDLHNPPYRQSMNSKAKNGFYFETIKENGGGTTLIYDREKSTAFVYFVSW